MYTLYLLNRFSIHIISLCSIVILMSRADATPCDDIVSLKKYLKTQKFLVEYLDLCKYDVPKIYTGPVKSFVARHRTEQAAAVRNLTLYLENPINCFVLLKGLTRDLQHTEYYLQSFADYQRKLEFAYPTTEEYHLAAGHITTLVAAYNLSVPALAKGNISANFRKDRQTITMINTPLTASDCYELAMTAYDNYQMETAMAWLMEAVDKYDRYCSGYRCRFTDLNLYLFISIVNFDLERFDISLRWLEKIKTAKETKTKPNELYEKHKAYIDDAMKNPKKNATQKPLARFSEWAGYCVKEYINHERLHCQHRYGPHPFLRLARFKAEYLHQNPDVIMFHDVISDKEIRVIQGIAKEKIKESKASKTPCCGVKISDARQHVFISDHVSSVAADISIRSLDISGLNSALAENIEVVHYPATGFHQAHLNCASYTHSTHNMPCIPAQATIIYYLEEPKLGGAIMFPSLSLSVFPVKNSAVFWSSSHPSKKLNEISLNMDCPVLFGRKWQITKWLSDVELVEKLKNRLAATGKTLKTTLNLHHLNYERMENKRLAQKENEMK